ncbi:MAG TPA: hypothetical protein ENL01_02440 [Chlorobaculum parvum]|uniref:Uncharacterized protein n=1 Tax=Chlorobaculum parvum TaxID=274539 RepID=A0A7C5HPC2_9CHLB|nr:hypothetical protein [Chlorobaculum parvum]
MKIFPNEEEKKRFMKHKLPLVFAVAWTPIVWMALTFMLGPLLERMVPVWQLVVLVIALATALAMVGIVRFFRFIGLRVFGE